MEKIIIDCHNHTKWSRFDTNVRGSDWFNYVEDFAEIARDTNLTMCAVTEHDVVNRKLKELLGDTDILVPEAVEISAKNYDKDKSLHILYYAKTISREVDDLLSDVLNNKKQMLNLQIKKLAKFWFEIDLESVMDYVRKQGAWDDWMNKWNMTKYLFEWKNRDINTLIFYGIFNNLDLWNQDEYKWFYNSCMKSGWEFYNQYKIDNLTYEPDVTVVWELAKKDNAIMSIAHPNFTFKKGVEYFKKELPDYIEKWVNAIEFNAKVDYKWGKAIMESKEKYDLILTFGSDCHMIWWDDDKHATFWTVSPFINQDILEDNLAKFRTKTWI